MFQETVITSRPDIEIKKQTIVAGDYSIVPYEESRCKVAISKLICSDGINTCKLDVESRVFSSDFNGTVVIGDSDNFLDRDFELILGQMCCGEVCSSKITYRDSFGKVIREVSCEIKLEDVTEEQLISEWSWQRLFESSLYHKDKGVLLVREKRIIDAFRRFSRALKMLIAIEPVDPEELGDESLKNITDLKVKLYNNLAYCQLHYEEYEAALQLCNRSLEYDKKNEKAFYRRSMAYYGLKMYEEAWLDIQEALKLNPSDKSTLDRASLLRPIVEKINRDYTKVIKNMFS